MPKLGKLIAGPMEERMRRYFVEQYDANVRLVAKQAKANKEKRETKND